MQRLAHETWDDVSAVGKRRVDAEDLHRTLGRLLTEQHMVFEAMWQRLTLAQRATLRAVVLAEGRELLRPRSGSDIGLEERRPCRQRSRRSCAKTS